MHAHHVRGKRHVRVHFVWDELLPGLGWVDIGRDLVHKPVFLPKRREDRLVLCINKLLREGLLGSSMEEQLKYITEGASTADGMTCKNAKLCFLLGFMVTQTETPNRSHVKRKSCRDGVVYGRDNLDKFVKGTLLLCRKFPVEKTVDF